MKNLFIKLLLATVFSTPFALFAETCADAKGEKLSKNMPCSSTDVASPLALARQKFSSQISLPQPNPNPVPVPPAKVFQKLTYPSSVGNLTAYLSPDPEDGKKHPAIIWMTGGDSNSIGELWQAKPRSNDQTAAQYRQAGIIVMFPSLRGGNDNPGKKDAFYNEVQDILAAADFLAKQSYVDANRIYLGGHSTGGTLVLLTAEISNRFRAVFSFGPVDDVSYYGKNLLPVDFTKLDPRETSLRAPINWLSSVRSRVFVIEGQQGNISSLIELKQKSTNPLISFLAVNGASHFSVLAPSNELIAKKILNDTGPKVQISLTEQELNAAHSGR